MTYAAAISARRAFTLPGYRTLAQERFDGDYVSPTQMTSGNPSGPMVISKGWLDVPSVRAKRDKLQQFGYLKDITYYRVMDLALDAAGLARGNIHIPLIFDMLVHKRSRSIPARCARVSFDAVGRHEVMGRRPVALGNDSGDVLDHFGIEHVKAPHPSARKGSFAEKAERIADALKAIL